MQASGRSPRRRGLGARFYSRYLIGGETCYPLAAVASTLGTGSEIVRRSSSLNPIRGGAGRAPRNYQCTFFSGIFHPMELAGLNGYLLRDSPVDSAFGSVTASVRSAS
jgi:hypothetical protein